MVIFKRYCGGKMVYHYCSLETFLNIIRNRTLRLSDLCNSTDMLEMKALLDIIENKVKTIYMSRKDEDFNGSVIYGMDPDDAFVRSDVEMALGLSQAAAILLLRELTDDGVLIKNQKLAIL